MAAKDVEKQEVVTAAPVVAEPPKPVVAKDKYVEVTPKVTGKRFVGGQWLDLVKDKDLKVTEDQKRVLKTAGAIYI